MSWDNENYRVILGCKNIKPYLALVEYPYGDDWKQEYWATPYIKEIEQLGVSDVLNGKILIQCDVEIEEIKHYIHEEPEVDVGVAILPGFECDAYCTKTLGHFELLEKACMECYSLPNVTVNDELNDYLQGKKGYAIHLKNIDILEEPRDVSECDQYRRPALHLKHLPRNMCDCYNYYGWWNILITLTPQEMCNVLNGKQTIIIRKEILEDRLKRLIESRWKEDEDE